MMKIASDVYPYTLYSIILLTFQLYRFIKGEKMNNFRGIILEGYSNAGKTSVLKSLKKLQACDDAERSIIILSEHYSQVLHKVNGELKWLGREEHLQLLKD